MSECLFFACLFIKIKLMIKIIVNSYRNDKILLYQCYYSLEKSRACSVFKCWKSIPTSEPIICTCGCMGANCRGIVAGKPVPTNVEDKKAVTVLKGTIHY